MRKLTLLEKNLITKLFLLIPENLKPHPIKLDQTHIKELRDGGMGSFIFLTNNKNKRFVKQYVVSAYCVDIDSSPIYIGINVDTENQLYELDSWKLNGNPLLAPLGTIPKIFDQEWNEIFSDA